MSRSCHRSQSDLNKRRPVNVSLLEHASSKHEKTGEIRLRSKDKQLCVIIINAIKFPPQPPGFNLWGQYTLNIWFNTDEVYSCINKDVCERLC